MKDNRIDKKLHLKGETETFSERESLPGTGVIREERITEFKEANIRIEILVNTLEITT